MELTWNLALKICKELWGWCAETGLGKEDWPGWEKYGEMDSNCPFCHYVNQMVGHAGCTSCLLVKHFNEDCYLLGYRDWECAETDEERKKYARIFFENLEQIPEKQDDEE